LSFVHAARPLGAPSSEFCRRRDRAFQGDDFAPSLDAAFEEAGGAVED
jgi:hypothetical protein